MLRMMKVDFADWLIKETEKRGWSYRELGRRSGLSSGAVSQVITRRTFPGPNFCNGVATAFKMAPERVFRLAGLLPPIVIGERDDELKQQCDEHWQYLTYEQRRIVTDLILTLYERREEYTVNQEEERA